MSIRGQGILTERGLRGIGVIVDGIPVNDPSGFAPDLYDVDFASLKSVEVLRGPAASLYGGCGAAGVLDITTNNGGPKPVGAEISQTIGSNGFKKSLIQLDGSKDAVDYRIAYSRTGGAGYRDHQAFRGNKLYEKLNFHPSEKLTITQIISHIDYFHQNPEGLNLSQLNNPRQANPDACPFNEYQKTNRTTFGLVASYKISKIQDVQLSSYFRTWNYKETSNRCAEYRTYVVPGASAQYNLHLGSGNLKNHFSIGTDLKWQNITMYKLQSVGNPFRVESIDQTNIETSLLLANQVIIQSSYSVFTLYKLEIGKFNLMGSLRYDAIKNELINKMMASDTARTSKNFTKVTARLGGSYSFSNAITVFANWSQGFMPPSTEELASNPTGYSGFNTHLVPATSNCSEIGFRGFYKEKLYYEITGFIMNTENDFFRFKQSGRGNQEVFYGNAGNSKRNGIEAFASCKILQNLSLKIAFTFADYKYTTAKIDPVYADTAYVLTTPPAAGQYLPNSPKLQLYTEIVYFLGKNIEFSLGAECQSKWAVYTDAKAYNGELDPLIYQNWQEGFNLFHTRVSYHWTLWGIEGECSLYARNFTGAKYMAFTEPDPDGNSYQPGPGREFFGNVKINF
jgi:iron complex outermembrane receptor protein